MARRASTDSDARQAASAEREFEADLARLMDLEERLGREQAAGEAQAARIVGIARDAAAVRLRALDAELEAQANRLVVSIEAERDRQLALLSRKHHDEAAVYAAVDAARADALARWAVTELLRRLGASAERRTPVGEGEP